MINRRIFLKQAAIAGAAISVIPKELLANVPMKNIGIQLYTLRDLVNDDLPGTLRLVSGIGYSSIEAAGYSNRQFYGLTPSGFRQLVIDSGLDPLSSHSSFGLEQADQVIEDTLKAGMRCLVIPSIPREKRLTPDHYRKLAEEFNRIGELCQKAGLIFGYHNHAFEFETMDSIIPYDLLLEETEPELVTMQLDLYWMVYAGYNPADYFQRYPQRFRLWHAKDMAATEAKESTEVGSGIIDYASLLKMKEICGLEFLFVEQESFTINPVDSITQSFKYLNSL